VPGRTLRPDPTPPRSGGEPPGGSNLNDDFTEGAAFLVVIRVANRFEIEYPVAAGLMRSAPASRDPLLRTCN
jgi:hypothetical protein